MEKTDQDLNITTQEARGFIYCPSCAKEKSKGLVTCRDCFKGRTPNTPPLKYYEGSFSDWLRMLYREEV